MNSSFRSYKIAMENSGIIRRNRSVLIYIGIISEIFIESFLFRSELFSIMLLLKLLLVSLILRLFILFRFFFKFLFFMRFYSIFLFNVFVFRRSSRFAKLNKKLDMVYYK